MASGFIKVSCRDCGNEVVIFKRAATTITCGVCGATLAQPSGGNAKLVGCTVVEAFQ